MADNILTAAEAAAVLRVAEDDTELLNLLPLIDAEIKAATGRAWEDDETVHPLAKKAARVLLIRNYEDPGMLSKTQYKTLNLAWQNAITQLTAEALKYKKYEFEGLSSSGYVSLEYANKGDQVLSLVGIWGVSGDQTSDFESVVSESGYLRQTSGSDLSDNGYLVTLISGRDALD
jgi:hypothetical protein